jgi:ribonuclease R
VGGKTCVAHYVHPDTGLDREAFDRGNSVYFPERVIPMLPEVLSNGLCSLNPDVDRLCLVCEMMFDKDGQMTGSRFVDAVMRSHARFTYTEVAAILVDGDKQVRKQHKQLVPHLEDLYRLYKTLRKVRNKRGAIDFETTETRIVFGKDRKIERIIPLVRNDAPCTVSTPHRLARRSRSYRSFSRKWVWLCVVVTSQPRKTPRRF